MATASIHPGMPGGYPPEPGRTPAVVLAVLVHLIFLGVLVFGLRWSSKAPEAVVVELWNPSPVVQPQVTPVPKVKPPPPPPPPQVESAPVPKPVPKIEPPPAPARKPDIAVEQIKKPPKKPEPKPAVVQPPPKPLPKPEQKLKFDQMNEIQRQLQQELQPASKNNPGPQPKVAQATSPPPASAATDPRYGDLIRSKIRGNIVIPQEVVGNPESQFKVIQLPNGDVESVERVKSSGNKALDDAWERAIKKSSPLPRPDRPDQFRRELTLTFRPQD